MKNLVKLSQPEIMNIVPTYVYTLTIYLSLIDCPVLCEKTNIKSDFDEGCRVLSVSAVGDVI